jgi:hypothetical protein
MDIDEATYDRGDAEEARGAAKRLAIGPHRDPRFGRCAGSVDLGLDAEGARIWWSASPVIFLDANGLIEFRRRRTKRSARSVGDALLQFFEPVFDEQQSLLRGGAPWLLQPP